MRRDGDDASPDETSKLAISLQDVTGAAACPLAPEEALLLRRIARGGRWEPIRQQAEGTD